MKTTKSILRAICLAVVPLAITSLPQSAQAQLSWGTNGTGGSSTWNATNTNWYNGASNVVWDSTSATFAGTAGAVTVSGTQNATGLTFSTSGYTLGGSGAINLTGAPVISGLATINTVLSGTSGMTLQTGSKTLGGDNTGLSGLVTLNGTSSFVAARIANSNALGSSSALADRVNIVNGGSGATLQLNSGIILPKYITTVGTTTIETITGNTSLTGNLVPGGTLVFSLAASTNLTLSGSAGLGQSGSSIQTTGTGRLIVDAAAGVTAYGLQIRNSASVQVNSGATLGSANVFFDGAAGAPILSLNGSTVSNSVYVGSTPTPVIENMAAGSSTFNGQILNNGGNFTTTLRSTTSGTLNVSGLINDSTRTASVSIGSTSFSNSGVVNLSRATGNTYDGGTTVHSGTLLVSNTSNSATGTGAVTVASGAILGGSGFITGAVTVNGTLAPGTSAGIINTGALSLSSGSLLAVEINGITAGTLYDQVKVTGSVTLGGNLDVVLGYTPVETTNFFIIDNDGAEAVTGLLNGYAQGDFFTLHGSSWLISYEGNIGTNAFLGGNDVVIQAIPEPSTTLLVGLGLAAGLFGLRRRTSLRA